MPKFIEGHIECPFYISEGNRFITCEGLIKDTVSIQKFKTDKLKVCHETGVCSVNGGKNCIHYKNILALYERGVRH